MAPSHNPAVSVVLPTYNRAYCISRAIQSILNQTFTDWELVVVDNHSTDNTEQIIACFKDARLRFVRFHNHGVIAASRNYGITLAKAPIIAFLDSDDWWAPDKLERCMPLFATGADVVYHPLFIVRVKQKSIQSIRTRALKHPVYLDLLRRGNAIPTSGTIVRKILLEQVGGFSEEKDLISWEDYDCWLRISKLTDNFKRINKSLGYYAIGSDNLTTSDRILSNLNSIENRYLGDLNRLPFWYYEHKAFAYRQQGKYLLSYKNMGLAILKSLNLFHRWYLLKTFAKWLLTNILILNNKKL